MNSKEHFFISLLKSVIRIASSLVTVMTSNFYFLAVGMILAEILGILEEIADKR